MTIEYIAFNKWVDGRGESMLEERALQKFCKMASSNSSQHLESSSSSSSQHQLGSSSSSNRHHLGSIVEVVFSWYTILVRFLDPLFGLSSHLGNLADFHLATALAQSSITDFGIQFRGLFEIHLRTIL